MEAPGGRHCCKGMAKKKRELEKQAARERRAEPVSGNSTQAENVPEENNEPTESQCEGVEEELEMSM